MGRYPMGRCPSCGNLAHMCQCGTLQEPSQLPLRIQRAMQGYQPRGYFQQGPQPPYQMPMDPRYAAPQMPAPQMPAPRPQPPTVDQIMAMPEIQQRVNAIVENALASYAPPTPMIPAMGIPPEALAELAELSKAEVPGEPPKNNTGGRLNSYNKGREEVMKYVEGVVLAILEGYSNDNGAGEPAAQGGFANIDPRTGQVQGVLPEGYPAG